MTINKTIENGNATFALEGKLDANTSTQLLNELDPVCQEGSCDITLDFAKLSFISSAGLRVLFTAHKKCKANGKTVTVINENESIKEIFAITGYSSI